jgi:hypothetical protein
MSVELFKEAKGNLYLQTGMQIGLEIANARYFQPFVKKLYENKDLITNVGIVALAAGFTYMIHKTFCNAGNSELLQIKPQNALILESKDGSKTRSPLISGTVINSPMELFELKNVSVDYKSTTTVLIDNINELETREDLISWVIKYQHLTNPESDGKDTLSGTVGCGLVLALRLAVAGENLGVTDDAPKKALFETIRELRDTNQLALLNGTNVTSFYQLQKIETRLHNINIESYDIIGAALTHLGVNIRTALCYATAKTPSPDYAKATLGATRMLNGFVKALSSFGDMMHKMQG